MGPNLRASTRVRTASCSPASYNLPSFSVNLRWRHLPSVVTAAQDCRTPSSRTWPRGGGRSGFGAEYTPSTALSHRRTTVRSFGHGHLTTRCRAVWRGQSPGEGPAITGKTLGRPTHQQDGRQNAADIPPRGGLPGCVTPTSYSLGSRARAAERWLLRHLGRRYYVGIKAQFEGDAAAERSAAATPKAFTHPRPDPFFVSPASRVSR